MSSEDRRDADRRHYGRGLDWKPGPDPDSEIAEYVGAASGPVHLSLEQDTSGPVTVNGWDKNDIRILATRRIRGTLPRGGLDTGREALRNGEVLIQADGDKISVHAHRERRWGFWDSERVYVAIDAWVPRASGVDLDSGSGRVEVSGTMGPVRVDSGSGGVSVSRAVGAVSLDLGSGAVSVEDVQGHVKADIGSGAVAVTRVKGDVEIDGSSGSVSLREVDGSIEVDTASGSVRMERIIGDVSVDTGSGSVRLDTVRSRNITVDTGSGNVAAGFAVVRGGRYAFDTGSGGITLAVPEDASFTLEADTGSGRIDCSLPLVIARCGRRNLTGSLGDGSARIAADTSSGSIAIRSGHGLGAEPDHRPQPDRPAGSEVREAVSQLRAENRNAILKMIQDGRLTAAQGEALLRAVSGSPSAAAGNTEESAPPPPDGNTEEASETGEVPPSTEATEPGPVIGARQAPPG
jgi:DUF4097 and DUF4098 domain-containing protein YvlB